MLADYEVCRKLERSHQCAACGAKTVLVTRYNAAGQSWEVICPCGNGENFAQRRSLTAQWREDPGSVPVHVANKLESRHGGSPMSDKALSVTNSHAMEQRIQRARFLKDLTPGERQLLAEVASAYGLDPVMGELIPYEGRPYLTVDGLTRIAHRSQCFAGLEDRPMTGEEKAAYGYTAPVCWLAKVYRSDWKVPAVGTGTADAEHPYRRNLVEQQFPQRMARVRAIRQALKLAFPNALPFASESAEERGVVVDRQTGEILEAPVSGDIVEVEAVEVVATQAAEATPAAVVEAAPPSPPVRPTALHKAFLNRYGVLYQEAIMLGLKPKAVRDSESDEAIAEAGQALAGEIANWKAEHPKAPPEEPAF